MYSRTPRGTRTPVWISLLHGVRSSASSFNFRYLLFSSRSSSSCLRLEALTVSACNSASSCQLQTGTWLHTAHEMWKKPAHFIPTVTLKYTVFFYRVREHGTFLEQKARFRQHLPRELRCSCTTVPATAAVQLHYCASDSCGAVALLCQRQLRCSCTTLPATAM
jgi:hypothetical protein